MIICYREESLDVTFGTIFKDKLFFPSVAEQHGRNQDMLGLYTNSFGCLILNNISGYDCILNSEPRLAETKHSNPF